MVDGRGWETKSRDAGRRRPILLGLKFKKRQQSYVQTVPYVYFDN